MLSGGAGFYDLTGSEKQIVWDSKIRQDFIDKYFLWDKLAGEGREFTILVQNENNSARFWIDNRDECAELYIKISKPYQQIHPQTKKHQLSGVFCLRFLIRETINGTLRDIR